MNAITSLADAGKLFESLVFWELYQRFGNLFTAYIYCDWGARYECDFVLYQEGGIPLPVQAYHSLAHPDTRYREMKTYGATTG